MGILTHFSMCFALSCGPIIGAAMAAPPLEVLEIPAAGGWSTEVPAATQVQDANLKRKIGRLSLKDQWGVEHYCTASLIVGFKNGDGGPAPSTASLLLTAAHCARPEFYDYSFTSADGATVQIQNSELDCITRNKYWKVDPRPTTYSSSNLTEQFINARLDYAFFKIKAAKAVTINDFFRVSWIGDWQHDNPLKLANRIDVFGYPDASGSGTVSLSSLSSGELVIRPDFYHQKLNAITTPDTTFTKGTSGGPWLNNSNEVVSLTSSYIARSRNSAIDDYITIYGPMLHEDAHQLALFTEQANNAGRPGYPLPACMNP